MPSSGRSVYTQAPHRPTLVALFLRRSLCAALLISALALPPGVSAANSQPLTPQKLHGLLAPAIITRDINDIPHIQAANEHDMAFLQGYVHAADRLFQMDVSRREASGTLSELVGPAALAQDVQLRTFGLRRAAIASLPLQSPRALMILNAYADGINAWVSANPLPPEYKALSLTKFAPWTVIDSLAVVKLIAFGLSFDISDLQATTELLSFQLAGQAAGFDGNKLFFQDIERSAPFDPASTVPDASAMKLEAALGAPPEGGVRRRATFELAKDYLEKSSEIPLLRHARQLHREGASNEFVIGSAHSASGVPLLENDPHLSLGEPSTWYPIHLQASEFDVIGNGFPGTPGITLGHNQYVSWGATNDGIDATDLYQEEVVSDSSSPSGLSSIYQGTREHIIAIPEVFKQNNPGSGTQDNITVIPAGGSIPPATLIVSRHGPIISLDLTTGAALTVQWAGLYGTHELDAILIWSSARNMEEFMQGLPYFSSPPQNIAYSDVRGNIAYFGVGEMPVREDLQAGTVAGAPPFFVRNGTGGNEWLPAVHKRAGQSLPFEILPYGEMPHVVNPASGFFVNSNNDPVGVTLGNNPLGKMRPGGGIYYLGYTFDPGFRAGRITELIRETIARGGKLSFADMQRIQSDVVLHDAEFFVPYITKAYGNARTSTNPALTKFASDPAITEAIGRLAAWNFTTPTGIADGYDGGDSGAPPFGRSSGEIANSVAATLYSVWRGQFVDETLVATLSNKGLGSVTASISGGSELKAIRHLLESFSSTKGKGASGLNFFSVAGVSNPAVSRDIIILQSLKDSLTLLASPAFAAAFAESTNQDDYRWGQLHRISFDHILGPPFSVPPAGGAFPQPLANLPGIPTDGGYQTVDAASHPVTANTVNGFMFNAGPSQRFVSVANRSGMQGVSSLPGGISGVLGSPYYINLLPAWLTNQAYPQWFQSSEIHEHSLSVTWFVPGP